MELEKTLELAFLFHGHRCVLMPLGVRMGNLALKELSVGRAPDRDPVALLELSDNQAGGCLADGVQVATGCTFGKGNIKRLQYGKFALTLVSKKKKQAVRVSLRPEIMMEIKSSQLSQLRAKGVPFSQIPRETADAIIETMLAKKDEELFKVEHLEEYHLEEEPLLFRNLSCSKCGEIVAEDKARLVEGKPYCIPCSGYAK